MHPNPACPRLLRQRPVTPRVDTHAVVLDRVRKLLRLAQSDNLHEAGNAAAAALGLLDRHRIDGAIRARLLAGDSGLGDSELGDPAERIVDGRGNPLDSSKRLRKWKIFLAAGLAPLNDCRVYTQKSAAQAKLVELVTVGRQNDMDALRIVYEFLVTTIEMLTRSHGQQEDRQWRDSFRLGAADTLVQRLLRQRAELTEALLTQAWSSKAPSPEPMKLGGRASTESAHVPEPAAGAIIVSERELLDQRGIAVDTWMNEHLGASVRQGRGIRYEVSAFEAGGSAAWSVALDRDSD